MPDDDPVLVSEPVEWAAEFRFFVRDRRVGAWSPYSLTEPWPGGDDWIVEPNGGDEGPARPAVADPSGGTSAALVIDAGIIRGVGPAVVEANEASGAGFYGCDPREVLEVLRAATVKGVVREELSS